MEECKMYCERNILTAVLIALMLPCAMLANPALAASEEAIQLREAHQSLLDICMSEPYERLDFCEKAYLRDSKTPEFEEFETSGLSAIVDGSAESSVTLTCTEGDFVDIKFRGARRWLNHVSVEFEGQPDFSLMGFDSEGNVFDFEIIDEAIESSGGSHQILEVELEAVRVSGIRWVCSGIEHPSEEFRIFEISGWFLMTDPDPNDPQNWLLCETGDATIGPPDITPLWNRIRSRPSWCPSGWHYCHLWVPMADWAGDFTIAAMGGAENSHANAYTGIDYHDLSVIACHGAPCNIWFSTGPAPADNVLTAPNDVMTGWGNRDSEWFCALSCSPYAFPCAWQWAWGFNGSHLQCGFTTTAWATGGAFLGGFAGLMTRPFFPMPISKAWFVARARWQGAGTCVIVLADDKRAYRDHLWGPYGYVSPDPTLAAGTLRGIVWARWDPPFSAKDPRTEEFPPALTGEQESFITTTLTDKNTTFLPKGSPVGVPISIPADLDLSKDIQQDMDIYDLIPMTVDQATIEDLADEMCINYGILCSPVVEMDEDGSWWAVEDQYAVWGDPEHGHIEFIALDDYLDVDIAPPVLDTGAAHMESQYLLQTLGLLPTDAYMTSQSFNVITAYDLDAEEIIPDSSFDLSVNTELMRYVDSYPVFGPGGYITVTIGEQGMIQYMCKGGWHQLGAPTPDSILSPTEALTLLADQGENATIGGIPPIYDELVIESTELAYYNTNGEYETDILEPIYHFEAYAVSGQGNQSTDIYVPCRRSLLRGYIDSPEHGSVFQQGDMITFQGSATGGNEPYTFYWSSDVDGDLGVGDVIMTDALTPAYKGDEVVDHSIALRVEDSDGKSVSALISIRIEPPPYVCGDADGSGGVDIDDVVYLINYIFGGGPPPDPLEAGDADCSGNVDIDDAVYIIFYIFAGGNPPCDIDGDGTPDC
jgi:hypothetical protein